jgi:hypothetical protein
MKYGLLFIFLGVLFLWGQAEAQGLWPDYAGKQACFGCHTSIKPIDLTEFNRSGHPWKIERIDSTKVGLDGVFRPFPTGTNELGVPLAPEALALGYHYDELYQDSSVSFLIGGFGWKARWMNKDGYIFEGTKAQYNLGTIHPDKRGHASYNAANVGNAVFALRTPTGALYNCGACHTTGWKKYDAVNSPYRFENRPGFDGTFFEFGVQCEGCHGPAKQHTQTPGTVKPPKDGFNMCKSCHARGLGLRIPVKSDKQFLDHREQYDQMLFTKHRRSAAMTCVTCHDPHKSTVYDLGGLKSTAKTCQPCHQNKLIRIIKDGVELQHNECRSCHMPYIGNTAVKQNNNRGDQASHMWKINTNPVTKHEAMFDTVALNVIIPPDSNVAHTLDFTCLGCHTTRDVAWASGHASNMHGKTIIVTSVASDKPLPSAYYLKQNYPNPFNPSTSMSFGLPTEDNVMIVIFNSVGEKVRTLLSGRLDAGVHTISWDGTDETGKLVASGVYLYKLETDNYIESKKMLLMK